MCGHPPPAAHTSLVGSRHQVKKSVHDLSEKATPGCPDIAVGIQTNIWHPTEARLEARGPAQREENGFLRGHSSVPGCCSAGRAGQSQAISTHATSPAPQSVRPRVYSNEARNCTYIGRSKVLSSYWRSYLQQRGSLDRAAGAFFVMVTTTLFLLWVPLILVHDAEDVTQHGGPQVDVE